jgi:rare lipoprotein A
MLWLSGYDCGSAPVFLLSVFVMMISRVCVLAWAFVAVLVLPSCAGGRRHSEVVRKGTARPVALVKSHGRGQVGIASIYTDRRTASGERFNAGAMAAAHKTLPLGSKVRVTHLGNGRSCIVRINDRGPYVRGRIIDLTPRAAAAIGLSRRAGVARVRVERL